MADRHVSFTAESFESAWTARLVGADRWSVEFVFVNRGRSKTVAWTFDADHGILTPDDRLASQIGFVADDDVEQVDAVVLPAELASTPAAETSTGHEGAGEEASGEEAADRRSEGRRSRRRRSEAAKKAAGQEVGGQEAPAKKRAAKKAASEEGAGQEGARGARSRRPDAGPRSGGRSRHAAPELAGGDEPSGHAIDGPEDAAPPTPIAPEATTTDLDRRRGGRRRLGGRRRSAGPMPGACGCAPVPSGPIPPMTPRSVRRPGGHGPPSAARPRPSSAPDPPSRPAPASPTTAPRAPTAPSTPSPRSVRPSGAVTTTMPAPTRRWHRTGAGGGPGPCGPGDRPRCRAAIGCRARADRRRPRRRRV